jgi:hypothetical protein
MNEWSETFWQTFYSCWLLNSPVLTLPSLHSSYESERCVASQYWVYIWSSVSPYMYTASPVVIQTPAHWKLIGCGMFALPPALSLLQPSYHRHNPHLIALSFLLGKLRCMFKKFYYFQIFLLLWKLGNLKLCKSGSVCTHQKTSTLLNSETRCPLTNEY